MTTPPRTKHGGPRPGGGRKPIPPELKRKPYAMRLSPDIHAFLQSRDNATAAIEAAIRQSSAFRWWRDKQ